MDENERIARAAGLIVRAGKFTTGLRKRDWHDLPDWRTDPGMVAKYLLPVLEARWPLWVSERDFFPAEPFIPGPDGAREYFYSIWKSEHHMGSIGTAKECTGVFQENSWHEAVIAAILATGGAE